MSKKRIIMSSIAFVLIVGLTVFGVSFTVSQHKKVSSTYIKHGEQLYLSPGE